MLSYSRQYDDALAFAARAHQGQVRKGSNIPYIAHAMHVATILIRYGYPEHLVIAGLLHDTIENTDTDQATIAAQFGDRIAQLVAAVSKPPGVSWEEGREALIRQVEQGNREVAILKAADMLHNARSILHDVQRDGLAAWSHFKRGPEPTLTYYRRMVKAIRAKLPGYPLCHALNDTVEELAQVQAELSSHTTQET